MIIAVAFVGVMEMATDDIVDMIPVWDSIMSTGRGMRMRLIVSTAGMRRIASCRVLAADSQNMLIHMIPMNVMQVPVVQIVCMAIMLNGLMTAAFAVPVVVSSMYFVLLHRFTSLQMTRPRPWLLVCQKEEGRSFAARLGRLWTGVKNGIREMSKQSRNVRFLAK